MAGDGQSVTVSAASSADPDGAVVSYVWDLDGDGVYDTAGPAAQTVAVAGRDAQRLTVAAVDNDNLVATATITVDEHSVPGHVGAQARVAIPWVTATRPERSATPLPCRRRPRTRRRIVVADSRFASALQVAARRGRAHDAQAGPRTRAAGHVGRIA